MVLNINYLAVLIAAIVSVIIGMVWYSPVLFGKLWIKWSNFNTKMNKAQQAAHKKAAQKGMIISFFVSIITAYILAVILSLIGSTTGPAGAQIGLLVAVGFVATTSINSVLWENKSAKVYILNNAHHLVSFAIMGAILGAWV